MKHRGLVFTAIACLAITAGFSARSTEQAAPPPISKDCQAPTPTLDQMQPMPNIAAALIKRKHIKILVMGATPMTGRRSGGRGQGPLIESILESAIKGLDVEIINRGVTGELTVDSARRLMLEVSLNEPDLVLWQVGTFDAMASISPEDVGATLTYTVRWLKEHKVDVVLVGLHYAREMRKDASYQAMRRKIGEVARKENVARIGWYEAMETIAKAADNKKDDLASDIVLTEAGYNCAAQYIARGITVGLFAKMPRKLPGAPLKTPAAQPSPAPKQ